MKLHWDGVNINHIHTGFSSFRDELDEMSKFKQHANSLIARGVNKTWERKGHLFSSRFRAEPNEDDESAEQQR